MIPMLSSPAPADLMALRYPIAAELKYDGVRCIASVSGKKCSLYSRNGKKLLNFEEIERECAKWSSGVYDGEVICPEGFQKLMTRTHADTGTNIDVKIEYKVFDKLTIDEWLVGGSNRTYTQRCIDGKIGERTVIKNPVDLDIYYNYVLKAGFEGLILKLLDSKYYSGDKSSWYKLKPKDTADLQIIGVDEGDGRCKGMVGALQCRGEIEGFTVHAYVGTGFTDEQREKLFKMDLKGKVVEVEYQELTKKDRYGARSLRFPVFKCLREDKS